MNLESISRTIGFLLLLNSSITLYYSPLVPMDIKNVFFLTIVGIVAYFTIIGLMGMGAGLKQKQCILREDLKKYPIHLLITFNDLLMNFNFQKKKNIFLNN